MKAIKVIGAYFAAVLVTFVLGSIFATQFILGNLQDMGMTVTFADRFSATLHDVGGLSVIYLPVIGISFLISLPVAAGIIKFVPNLRLVGYVLAGAVGLVTIHLVMKAVLGLTGIAATRTVMGLLSQGLAGAIGGYLFFRLTGLMQKEVPAVLTD
ncbi:MAG: hypothetical protein ABGY96_11355 [bacterium]|nr:hypothetical protein [Gammaproteobacteria bacterium]